MATEPRRAKLTGTVAWSDGELFDGFVLIGLALPSNVDGTFAGVSLDASFIKQRLPEWTVIKITDGVFDQEARLYFTADIEPPNTRYAAYWYALPKHRISPAIGVLPSLFSVSVDPYPITIPTLTVPTVPVTPPTPDD